MLQHEHVVGVDVGGMEPQPGVQEADQIRLAYPAVRADPGVVVGEVPGLAADGEVLGLRSCGWSDVARIVDRIEGIMQEGIGEDHGSRAALTYA